MKQFFIPISILTVVLVLSGIWTFQTGEPQNTKFFLYSEIIHVGVIFIFIILGAYFSYSRMQSRKKGFPEDDELSKRIVQKTAALSFYISLFLWLILLYIQKSNIINNKVLFSYGFIGMALIFIFTWIVLKSRGVRDV